MTDSLPSVIVDGPHPVRVLLAHGAGAGMDSAFMTSMARMLADRQIGVARFEFPYMQQRRLDGSRRPPDRMPVLMEAFRQQIHAVTDNPAGLVIAGKSMGGRVATMLADEMLADGMGVAGVAGVVCLGYPFHPQGKPQSLRVAHLQALQTPTLICQGSRDRLGSREEVGGYNLSPAITLHWLEDGDHDLKPRVRSGYNQQQHMASTADAIVDFMGTLRNPVL